MAREANLEVLSFDAAGDLSLQQYKLVELDGNGRVAVANAATDNVLGVLLNNPAALGRAAEVGMLTGGKLKAFAGAAVAIGAVLSIDATGRLVTGVATNRRVGLALTASSAAGQMVEFTPLGAGQIIP